MKPRHLLIRSTSNEYAVALAADGREDTLHHHDAKNPDNYELHAVRILLYLV